MDIGNRIRQRRKAKGLSQERLAREAGVTLSLISKIENGRIHDLHYSTLSGCAAALDMSVAQLIGEEPASKESAADEALQRLKDYISPRGRTRYLFGDPGRGGGPPSTERTRIRHAAREHWSNDSAGARNVPGLHRIQARLTCIVVSPTSWRRGSVATMRPTRGATAPPGGASGRPSQRRAIVR